jgi:hypothetical protein
MAKNDTVRPSVGTARGATWPHEDCIRWIESRVRELTIKNAQYVDERGKWLLEEKGTGGRKLKLNDKVADYAVWLLHIRDGLSWHQLAYRFFPVATEQNVDKYEQRVRRAYNRVEREHPGSMKYKPLRLSEQENLLLQAIWAGVMPVYLQSR